MVRRKTSVVAGIALGMALACSGVLTHLFMDARSQVHQSMSDASLFQLRGAFAEYLKAHKTFPKQARLKSEFKHSWRTELEQFVRGQYKQPFSYDYGQPWNEANNLQASRSPTLPYHISYMNEKMTLVPTTDFLAVTGHQTMFPSEGEVALKSVLDGIENTATLLEVSNSNVAWTQPSDIEFTELDEFYDGGNRVSLGKQYPDGPGILFADLAVFRMKRKIPLNVLKSLFTIDGGETWTRAALVESGYLVEKYPPVFGASDEGEGGKEATQFSTAR